MEVSGQLYTLVTLLLENNPSNHSISWDSTGGIATRYGPEVPGIESRCGEIFRTCPDRLRGPPSLLNNGYRVFPGGKSGRGVMLNTYPLLVPRLRKSWAIPPLPYGSSWACYGIPSPFYPFHRRLIGLHVKTGRFREQKYSWSPPEFKTAFDHSTK